MSTPFAVTAANAFTYYPERDIIELYAQHFTLYKRFMDDIFLIWDGTREILHEFLSAINTKHEPIKLNIWNKQLQNSVSRLVTHCNTLPFKNR